MSEIKPDETDIKLKFHSDYIGELLHNTCLFLIFFWYLKKLNYKNGYSWYIDIGKFFVNLDC